MQEIIDKFITLGKKAKVLLGVEDSGEPRVGVTVSPEGETIFTFYSTCFDFFDEVGFTVVKKEDVPVFIQKCELYVSTLEKNISIDYPHKDRQDLDNHDTFSNYLISFNNKTYRIKVKVCDKHLSSGNFDGDCKCKLVGYEELKNEPN